MTRRDVAVAAGVGGLSGVASMVVFAIALTSANKAVQDRKKRPAESTTKSTAKVGQVNLSVVPGGAS